MRISRRQIERRGGEITAELQQLADGLWGKLAFRAILDQKRAERFVEMLWRLNGTVVTAGLPDNQK